MQFGSSHTMGLFYPFWATGGGGRGEGELGEVFQSSAYLASSLMRLAMRRLSSTHRSLSDTCPRFPPPAGRILRSSRLWDSCYKNTHSFCDRLHDRFWDSCYQNTHSFCDRVQDRFWDSCYKNTHSFCDRVQHRFWAVSYTHLTLPTRR